jgi:hypothetical protein
LYAESNILLIKTNNSEQVQKVIKLDFGQGFRIVPNWIKKRDKAIPVKQAVKAHRVVRG